MGRKRMNPNIKKASNILIRLGKDQKTNYEKAAEKNNLPLSEWIRRTLDQKAIEEIEKI